MSAAGRWPCAAEVRRTAFPADTSASPAARGGARAGDWARWVERGAAGRGLPGEASGVGALCHSGAMSTTPEPQLDELTRLMREFSDERDWGQFHDPKSLILALVGEVGELAELFQWVPADEAVASVEEPGRRARAGEEIADVLLYLLRLADVLGIDVMAAARAKQAAARERFAVEHVRGVAPDKA